MELIIDPELAWSTYLGGSSSDSGVSIAVDDFANALVTGTTWSSGWASGGFDASYNGISYDAFVAKISDPIDGTSWWKEIARTVREQLFLDDPLQTVVEKRMESRRAVRKARRKKPKRKGKEERSDR